LESEHETVYGSSFRLYSRQDFLEFVSPIQARLALNGVSPVELFCDRRVLDAGCGNGRGSYLAILNGAKEIVAADISSQNLVSTQRLTSGLLSAQQEFRLVQSSLADLPLPDGYFDFIWCNGVVMHTANPSKVMTSLLNKLKLGGKAWIYIYGEGGFYQSIISVFRRIFATLETESLILKLKKSTIPIGRIAEFVDDWKTPYLRAYNFDNFSNSLNRLGFSVTRLMRGMVYDTCEQLFLGGTKNCWGKET